MNQEIRNKLRNVVTQCRKLLEDSVSQELEGKYGIFARREVVTADPNAAMSHLSEEEQTARKDILDHFGHIKARGFKPKDALDQLVREIAFTHLNRLCAYKMMEAREVYVGGQKFREAVSRGINSNGVKFYLADHPEEERLFNTGHQDVAYRRFLDWLGGLLSDEIGVLFNPNDPANRLYPRQKVLDDVLDLLNGGGIKPDETDLREEWPKIWSQDETIGWVYQYFTPKEMREAAKDPARGGSDVPRNSYELAFRNQFFTPRYVVEFLTDNTLGRIWYEMRKGNTTLKDQCRYMVRRSTEQFLKDGEQPPGDAAEEAEDLSQDELLKQPVHIPHRAKKDPRKLKVLDPACGSGHFLLYCFDLFLAIYEEAYADTDLGPALKQNYETLDDLRRDVPRLILAHNLHGIDIDLRASQIAALALWLRCQRAYQEMGLKKDRPKIARSNFVCAEPMPGEEQMLGEFVAQLERKVVGQVVEVVFDKMKLAGEAGSLLKIEEDIRDAVVAAKKQWIRETTQAIDRKGHPLLFTQVAMDRMAGKPDQPSLFDLSDITDAQFFEQAEANVIEALRQYAEKALNGQKLQRRLFSDDTARGFAFVDLCQKRYDVVLMNPPFGEPSPSTRDLAKSYCAKNVTNLLTSFICRSRQLAPDGMVGAITDSTWLKKTDYEPLREFLSMGNCLPFALADLGWGVLDEANVAVCAFAMKGRSEDKSMWAFRHVDDPSEHRAASLLSAIRAVMENLSPSNNEINKAAVFYRPWSFFTRFPHKSLAYETPRAFVAAFIKWNSLDTYVAPRRGYTPGDTFRFFRCWWEVPLSERGNTWWTLNNGSPYTPLLGQGFFVALNEAPEWSRHKECPGFRLESEQWFGKGNGIGWGKRTDFMYAHPLPEHSMFSHEGPAVFPLGDYYWQILGWLNTSICQGLINLYCGLHKTAGYVAHVPCPDPLSPQMIAIGEAAEHTWRTLQSVVERDETLDRFLAVVRPGKNESIATVSKLVNECKQIYCNGLSEMNAHAIEILREIGDGDCSLEVALPNDPSLAACVPFLSFMVGDQLHPAELLQWSIGVVFGRWNVQTATSNDGVESVFAPTDAIPRCSPGMLQTDSNLPATASPVNYPLRIEWDGMLVDDEEHFDDICSRMSEVLDVVWADQADVVEKTFCELLRVKELRDYFRKPSKGGFWEDHVARYTKSRRKAPIYWLLQSSKRNYAIWLYYLRLDKDLLFKALVNYVEPKIRLETNKLDNLRLLTLQAKEDVSGKKSKQVARDIEEKEDFLSELRDFEDKLRRAANLNLEPDLNDGVVLNIAPLWELVPWKEAKNYWEELIDGKYEWSTIGKQLRQKGLVK